MENKKWIWIGLAFVAFAIVAFVLFSRKKTIRPKQEHVKQQDYVKLVLDTLTHSLRETSQQKINDTATGKGYAGTTTDPDTGNQVALYDSDTVDKSSGMTFLQQSTNLINGQNMVLDLYRHVMGKDAVLCFKLSPVNTRIEMLGNATSGNGSIIPFMDKLNQNMKILNDVVAMIISRNEPDLFRQLGAIMMISLFMMTACTTPRQLMVKTDGNYTAITATMNQTELTTPFLVANAIPPSTISYKRKDVYDIENEKGKISMDAAQTYFARLAKENNLSTIGGTGDIAAAQQMGQNLKAVSTKSILIGDLGKILLLGTYYGPFGNVGKKSYPCDS
jgi:hypothetical protein